MDRDLFGTTSVVTDHGDLEGLGDDDHPQYLLVDGSRDSTGGQTFLGDVEVDGHLAVGAASASASVIVDVEDTISATTLGQTINAVNFDVTSDANNQLTAPLVTAFKAVAETTGDTFIATGGTLTGMDFTARHNSSLYNIGTVTGIKSTVGTAASATVSASLVASAFLSSKSYSGGKPLKSIGYNVGDMGSTGVTDSIGILVALQAGATNNYGIQLNGDGTGADIVFGANQDDKIYHDGTNLLADCANAFATNKGRVKNTTRVTTTYTILVTDDVIFANTDSSAFTVTLPVGAEGQTVKVINSGSSGNDLTLAPNGSEHLIGANSNFTLRDGETLLLTYNATDGWY